MKTRIFTFAAAVLAACSLFASCNKGSTETYGNGIATVKTGSDGYYVLQIDEQTVLVPETKLANPYGSDCRAFCSFIDKGVINNGGAAGMTYHQVQVTGLSKILTKEPAPNLKELNDAIYGHDPINIGDDWMTNVEDGYITIHFLARWGATGKTHYVNLVKDIAEGEPYTFELRHSYNGDVDPIYYREGIVAFDLHDIIDVSKSETYKIKVKYLSETGERTATFNYTPGEAAPISTGDGDIITSSPIE